MVHWRCKRGRPASLYLSGAAMAASMGLPDLGIITVDEVASDRGGAHSIILALTQSALSRGRLVDNKIKSAVK
jgi:hypothetical protein